MSESGKILTAAVFMLLLSPSVSRGQVVRSAQDSIPAYTIKEIVVTADRIESPILNTTAATSVLKANEIRRLPVTKLSDAFQALPGFFVGDTDGLGRAPIVSARGFYGGGEAEYLLVLLDGMPISDLETGLVDWNLVPLAEVASIEAVRGASSALYGDAALGGVINLRTHPVDSSKSTFSLNGGSFGIRNAGFKRSGAIKKDPYQLFASHESTSGFRAHSHWRGTTFGGNMTVLSHGNSKLRVSSTNDVTRSDAPGPLTAGEFAVDRSASSPYFRADGKDEKRYRLDLAYSARTSVASEFTADVSYGYREASVIRTFTTAPPVVDAETYRIIGFSDTSLYGDTKERELFGNEAGLRTKYASTHDRGPVQYRLLLGFDGDYGHLNGAYYRYFSGFADDYRSGNPGRGDVIVEGGSSRAAYALYVSNDVRRDPWRMVLGVRYDAIRDRYGGRRPDTTITATSTAVSPKFGINVCLANRAGYSGSIYGSVNRSFKAPTLDQLTDQRPIDYAGFLRVPTGPDSYEYSLFFAQEPPFSNPLLHPQTGQSYELGTYQRLKIVDGFSGEATVAVYQIDMKNEIDFDLVSFRYQNVQQSRHRGVESSVGLHWAAHGSAFVNYTWMSTRFTSGPYLAHYLKGIPRNLFAVGVTYEHACGFRAGFLWNVTSGIYLDDENTTKLSRVSTGSVRFSQELSRLRVFVDIANVLDEKYSSNGYMLNGTTYLYPAAGRVVQGGVEVEFR